MIAPPSRTRALVLAALLIVATVGAVATPTVVSAQADDEPNENRTTAMAIELDQYVTAQQDDERDTDWYRFDVEDGQHVRVISGEGHSQTPELTLYGPDGAAIGGGSGVGTADSVVAGTGDAAAGTYYLKATPDGVAGESYGFVVETANPDALEPNDDRSGAVQVEPSENSGTVTEGDSDWFAVDVSEGERLDATVSLSETVGVDNNAVFELYDGDGNQVGENPEDVATNNAPAHQTSRFDGRFAVTQSAVAEEAGTYYVRVAGVDTTGFTRYDLTTAVSNTSDGDGSDGATGDDGNDSTDDGRSENGSNDDGENGVGDGESAAFENATAVDSVSAIGNGQIGADGSADVYAFEMREGSQVELSQGSGDGAYPVTLLSEEGRVLGRIADQEVYRGEEDLLRANASYTGTHYLKIDGASGDRYSILGSVTELDANEPNDGRETATEIATGSVDRGTIVRGDSDYYAVELEAGETIDVFANSTATAALTMYVPSGSVIDSSEVPSRFDEPTGKPVTSVTADESGTYYLELSIQSNAIGRVGGEYAIELASAPATGGESIDGSSDETEPGDDEPNGEGSNADGTTDEATTTEAESDDTASTDPTTVSDGASNTSGDRSNEAENTTTETATDDGEAVDNEQATSGDSTPDSETTTDGNDAAPDGTTAGTTTDDDGSTTGDGATTTDDAGSRSTTDSPSNGTTDSSSGTDEQTGETGGTAPSGGAEKTAVDGPGFGLLAALLAVFGIGAFTARRD